MSEVGRFERKDPPDQEMSDAHVHRSEAGRLQMELDAPRIVQFRQPEVQTHYPKGVSLRFFAEDGSLRTTLRADKAVQFDDKNIVEAEGNVVVIDYTSGDTIYLEKLVWRTDEDLLYSNKPVKAVRKGSVTYGDGFTSDGNMSNLRVIRQRGTIEIDEE